jgi:hypothetical protein
MPPVTANDAEQFGLLIANPRKTKDTAADKSLFTHLCRAVIAKMNSRITRKWFRVAESTRKSRENTPRRNPRAR